MHLRSPGVVRELIDERGQRINRIREQALTQRRLSQAVGGLRAIFRRRTRLIEQGLVGGDGALVVAVKEVAVATRKMISGATVGVGSIVSVG